MRRLIEQELSAWKLKKKPMPLIIRGARQIGKSYVVEQFGKTQFDHCAVVNFELMPQLKTVFAELNPHNIVKTLELALNIPIRPQETLLFLDEIQDCPEAIMALRYFKEKMPDLHVIAAGSLLEFALQARNFRMPVGRVQFLYMKPLSFKEFLFAMKKDALVNLIETITWETDIPSIIHDQLLEQMIRYCCLGGMPGVLQDYLENQSFLSARHVQTAILATYRNDFGKYCNVAKHKYLEALFAKSPEIIAQQFRYVNVARDMQARDIKEALNNLNRAGLISQIFSVNATGLPLKAAIHEKRFKLLFLDLGLISASLQQDVQLMTDPQHVWTNRGALAEQFVGQECLAYQDAYLEPELYYWSRDERGSTAEVDYLLQVDSHILPVEVKAGSTGKMKSLHMFMASHQSPWGIRISTLPLYRDQAILSIPFYLVSELKRLVRCLGVKGKPPFN